MSAVATLKEKISPSNLLYGTGAAIFLYVLIFGVMSLKSSSTVQKLEDKLATETVNIQRPDAPQDIPTVHAGVDHQKDSTHVPEEIKAPEYKDAALRAAPITGFFEQGADGILPKKSDNNLTPFDIYKKPFSASGKPMIAIAIVDYGLDNQVSESLLNILPSSASLILSPYAAKTDDFQKKARAYGHEIWLQLPIQTEDYPYLDPGPQALLRDSDMQYNQKRLDWLLSRTSGYAGVAAASDVLFDSSTTSSKRVFTELFDRGLGYLELNPTAPPSIESLALLKGLPYARANVHIENTSLKAIESLAKDRGYAIAVFTPSPNGLKSLQTWLKTLEQKDIELAPLSAVAELSTQ